MGAAADFERHVVFCSLNKMVFVVVVVLVDFSKLLIPLLPVIVLTVV
jgi:hypothetical protein